MGSVSATFFFAADFFPKKILPNLLPSPAHSPDPPHPLSSTKRRKKILKTEFCYVDGQKVANSADRVSCESPLTLRVADGGNHTLEVALADVCGDVVRNGLYFGTWGWRLDQKYVPKPEPGVLLDTLPMGNDSMLPLPPRVPMARRARNGAGGGVAMAVGSALVGALVGAAALMIAV
jgi:hypothetical protein